jgi:NAD(P)H-hydrate epimerase
MTIMRFLTREQVREVDRRAIEECGMSGLVLMENAGRGCVDALLRLGCRGPVAVVCGRGNNAGDGFVIARHLELRDISVRVLLLQSPADLRGDAAANYAILRHCDARIVDLSERFDPTTFDAELAGCECIVDALLGTGASGPPRPPMDVAIRLMNGASAKRLAVDLPSGLDCDSGEPAKPTFRADYTCTFVAEKVGFSNPAAKMFLGQVEVVDIGVPRGVVRSIMGQTE